MRIGALNKRVTFQSPVNLPDGMGGITSTYSDEITVWAALWPVSANEIVKGTAPILEITHRIRIRYGSQYSVSDEGGALTEPGTDGAVTLVGTDGAYTSVSAREMKSSWRIKYGTRYFNIVSIVNQNESNRWYDIMAKEVA